MVWDAGNTGGEGLHSCVMWTSRGGGSGKLPMLIKDSAGAWTAR